MNEFDNDLVSIILPVYNGEKFIEETLLSVLAQTYKNLEIIIVDDGSTDGTAKILKQLSTDQRVQYHFKQNGGLSSARNTGITLARGSYLAFIDADDIWMRDKIEEQLRVMRMGKWGIVYCDNEFIDEKGFPLQGQSLFRLQPEISGFVSEKLIDANLVCGSGSGVLIPSFVFQDVGVFDPELPTCEDWDMWLRISEKYPISFVYKVLVKIRIHSKQMQSSGDGMFLGRAALWSKHYFLSKENPIFLNKLEWLFKRSLTLRRYHLLRAHSNSYLQSMVKLPRFQSLFFWIKAFLTSSFHGVYRKVRKIFYGDK